MEILLTHYRKSLALPKKVANTVTDVESVLTGVAVEKLTLPKFAEISSR